MEGYKYFYDYDKTSPESIEKYAKKLVGKTFEDVLNDDSPSYVAESDFLSEYGALHEDSNYKGGLGTLIEERYFHYKANSDSNPDFSEAGVELKVSPYKMGKDGSFVAKERLILTMIDYFTIVNEEFETSHMWHKSKLILLIYYLFTKDVVSRLKYRIDYVRLFTPPEQDLKIIIHDFYLIRDKIKAGKAHELSEGDTLYLGAATKAQTSADRRKQPFSDELAKPRAFSFKNSYMTYVLNNYIIPGKNTYETILNDDVTDSFEDYVVKKINAYRGKTTEDLCTEFDIHYDRRPKNLEAMIAYRILGIKGNRAEEFEKANIAVKTIRVGKNNKIKESMSFPTFRFKELIQEEWEDSTFGNYLRETRFLFVVYKFGENDELRLRGCQFWNIPYLDLEIQVKSVWERTKKVLLDGLQVTMVNGVRNNNFPKASENPVCHVRPHAQNAMDTYELPDGRQYPKQCFWLNNSYIYSQLNEDNRG